MDRASVFPASSFSPIRSFGKKGAVISATRRVGLGLLAVLLGFFPLENAIAETNPTESKETLYWRVGTTNYYEDDLVKYALYKANREPWCGHFFEGNRYDHKHLNDDFNYYSAKYHMTVTPDMVDAYWDKKFEKYTEIVDGPDQTYNCHGYTTGLNTWICSMGMQDIVDLGYISVYGLDATLQHTQSAEVPDHSKKLFDLYDAGGGYIKVGRIREKARDSGIYELRPQNKSLEDGFKKKP